MKRYLFLIFASTGIFNSAQESTIQTDRPDQTESPAIIPINQLQTEIGFMFEKQNKDFQNYLSPTILWKYGLTQNMELRMITEIATNSFKNQKNFGVVPLTFGFKVNLLEEQSMMPKTSFIGHLTTSNLGSKSFHTKHIAPSFRFLFQHSLSEKLNLGYNIGAKWNGETPDATGIYTISTAYAFSEKFGGFIELYGFLNKFQSSDHRFDGGITYLINQDFQLDASTGVGISEISPEYFFSFGVSYRFPLK